MKWSTMTAQRFDVAVVGLGPVGMAAAALLARRGRTVVAFDRYPGPYNLPRAATFDDETMRTFAQLGLTERLLPTIRYQPTYEWVNGAGELLLEYRYAERGASGWAEWYEMYQPDLEDALLEAATSAGTDVRYATTVTGYDQDDDGVTLTTDAGTVRATYVVAADGGNGFTREAIGARLADLGFAEPWLVCDFRYDTNPGVPTARQVGDPARPTSIIGLGSHHHRFSFMLDSVEDFAVESDPDRVWDRVAPYLRRDQADLVRVATYTFRSLIADRWRAGRIFLAGDAAHQMPPFLGQGMCSGIRDVRNLAFKLDLALAGPLDEHTSALLDTYQTEREPHVEAITRIGMELGRAQTVRDPVAAAERDARMLADRRSSTAPRRLRFPDLGDGLLSTWPCPGRGALLPQGRLATDDGPRLLDEAVAPGFQLVVRAGSPADEVAHRSSVPLDAVVRVGPADDVDDVYLPWLTEHDAAAVVVRPDGYVFGTAPDADATVGLLDDLGRRTGLAPRTSRPEHHRTTTPSALTTGAPS
jgi:3-(3-hydroxy-phenyl)propionate hydroxylase/flavoprotein hydroxylase